MSSLARTQEAPVAALTALWFTADGWVPNNQRLPALLYRQALHAVPDRGSACEALIGKNGWPPQWRNGIYPFHHFHPTAHEVLGMARGNGRVLLGEPNGLPLEMVAGDCVLVPAGTGHSRISASADLLVVGAPIRRGRSGTSGTTRCRQRSSPPWPACCIRARVPSRTAAAGLLVFWSQVA